MMLEVLGEATLRTALLAGVVQLGLWLLRIRRAQLLLVAWTVILAASLAMPALQWATPLNLPVFLNLPCTSLISPSNPQLQPSALEAPSPASVAEFQELPTIRPLLEATYLLVTSFLLLRLAVGVGLSLRLLGKAAPVRQDWTAKANVLISRDVAAPVTIANIILLPMDAVHWPPTMRQAILAHEQAHVARWDFAMLLLSQINRALFWFSPQSWWLHRRLAALAELASDDHAMEITGDRPGYAEVLLEMGRRSGPVLRGLAMARPATLRYRIERILSDTGRPNPVRPIQRVILAIGAAGLSIAAASSEPDSSPTPDVTARAEQQKPPTPTNATPLILLQAAKDVRGRAPLLQPLTEMASRAPPRVGPSIPSDGPLAISRSRATVRVLARPASKAMTRISLATQPSRLMQPSDLISNGQVALEASSEAKRAHPAAILPQAAGDTRTTSSNGFAVAQTQASTSQAASYQPDSKPPLLKLIDDRICSGVYLPDHASGFVNAGLNLVRAKFFRDASGTPWLTFFLGGHIPVVQPVTVTQGDDHSAASHSTVFTMLPKSTRHLRGFIQRPYGTIDFTCGGANEHLFDGGS